MPLAGTLGCLIRSAPFEGRSGRDQLDIVMAALLGGWRLELFFTGNGMLHLLADKDHAAAGMPGTWKGWKGLPELGPVRAWVEPGFESMTSAGTAGVLVPCSELDSTAMAERLAACDRVLLIG